MLESPVTESPLVLASFFFSHLFLCLGSHPLRPPTSPSTVFQLFSLCLTADLGPTLHTSASQDPQLNERDTASSEGKCGYDPSVTQTLLPKSLLLLCFLLLLLDPNQFKFQCQSRNQDSSSPSPSKQSLPSQFSYCYRYLHSSMWQSFVYLFYTFPI